MRSPPHPYIALRRRLAHQALLQFLASFKSSLEITVIVFGPVLLGLFAFIALPGLLAATLAWPAAIAVVLAQAGISAAPAWLLRKRLLPHDVLQWRLPLPIPAALEWRANAAVAGMLIKPLAVAYALSLAVWLYQWPAWLRPVAGAGIVATVLSLLLTWALATALLTRRSRAALRGGHGSSALGGKRSSTTPFTSTSAAVTTPHRVYTPRSRPPRSVYLWHQLFWLPFWRADNMVGLQQSVLCLGAALSATLWLTPLPGIPAGLLACSSSALLILLTDRGDKAVREHIAVLRPSMAGWPLAGRRIELLACVFSLVPALSLLAAATALLSLHGGRYSHKAALLYLGTATLAHCAIAGLPRLSARGRVSLVMIAILVLTAIGSELWN